jgi:hypothetical protein
MKPIESKQEKEEESKKATDGENTIDGFVKFDMLSGLLPLRLWLLLSIFFFLSSCSSSFLVLLLPVSSP